MKEGMAKWCVCVCVCVCVYTQTLGMLHESFVCLFVIGHSHCHTSLFFICWDKHIFAQTHTHAHTHTHLIPMPNWGWLWLRGRASILLLEGRWFDSPGLHVKVSLGKILNPELLLIHFETAPGVLVGTLHGSHRHQCMNACMN